MQYDILETIMQSLNRGVTDFSFPDSVLSEIVAEKVHLHGIVAIDVLGMEKYLLIRAYIGFSRTISKKEEIKLEFESFLADDQTSLLVFRMVVSKYAKQAILRGLKAYEFMSIEDDKLVVDLYKMNLPKDNELTKDYFNSLRDIVIDFSPGTITLKTKLLNNIQSL